MLTKYKCIAFTADDVEFHSINKGNNNNHNKNVKNNIRDIIENLDDYPVSIYNTNDNIEYTNNGNNTSISNLNSNSNAIPATNLAL